MKNTEKYTTLFHMPPADCFEWTKKTKIERPPVWCSVDLRDGNQALINPMTLEEKLEFFAYLVKVGFKEIEIGFPAASETEYEFTRRLIEDDLIPDDVTLQVLTQSREHIIKRTFEAIRGAKNVIVHLYNSTSVAQREQVFGKDKAEILKIATDGAKLLKELAARDGGDYRFEYSPESFTGTEPEYALKVCNAVLDVWKPTADKKAIINLPVTVSCSMPHVYACQVEYINKNLKYRDAVVLSSHPHNDRGSGVADAEMALLAGADRIEGTLFGNGERTGNVDIVTLALNMYCQGVDPMLDFSDINEAVAVYEKLTAMTVPPRQPYAGKLVFTAFSGSHQDAIAKGFKWRETKKPAHWDVPYLPIDPKDLGRDYEGDVIRINSQSGKGGIGYLLEKRYGLDLPPKMREDCGYTVKHASDKLKRELSPDEVRDVFVNSYVNICCPLELSAYSLERKDDKTFVTLELLENGAPILLKGSGNGQLDATANALKTHFKATFSTVLYTEHALEAGSHSRAAAYVGISDGLAGKTHFACGIDTDIMKASIKALIGSFDKLIKR